MTKIKEYDRKARKRERHPVVYIICEGAETEPKYFQAFRKRNCPIDIIPLTSQYKSADSLIKKVESTLNGKPYYPDEGDSVWCVFDCDENTNAMLKNAKEMADKKGYRIAYSNPCFEYWILLHYKDYGSYLENCDAVIRQLKKEDELTGYTKSADLYPVLQSRQSDAINRARNRLKKVLEDYKTIMLRETNPVTTVHELVMFLNEKRQ